MPAHGSLFTLRRHHDSSQLTRRHYMLCPILVRDRTYCVTPAGQGVATGRHYGCRRPRRTAARPGRGPVGVGLHGCQGAGVDDFETQPLPLGRDDECEPTGERAITLPPQQETLTRLLARLPRRRTQPNVTRPLRGPLLVPACLPHLTMIPQQMAHMFERLPQPVADQSPRVARMARYTLRQALHPSLRVSFARGPARGPES